MSKHSPFGPSSLGRRILCPGSYRMEKDLPETTSELAEHGTYGHDIMAARLRGQDGFCDDEDLADDCAWAMQFVEGFKGWEWRVEQGIDLRKIHPDIGWGTADWIAVQRIEGQRPIAVVVDWKFGRGHVRSAAQNPQLACYAAGVSQALDGADVTVYLVQCALRSISYHSYLAEQLHQLEGYLRLVVEACKQKDAPLIPDGEACEYCKANLNGSCPATKEYALALSCFPDAGLVGMPGPQLAVLLEKCEAVEKFIGTVKQVAFTKLSNNEDVPGWGLRTGRKSRAWGEKADTVIQEAAKTLGKKPEDASRTELISPAQLEKLWGKGAAALLAEGVVWSEGSLGLGRKKE
jgi:hypothetical protein